MFIPTNLSSYLSLTNKISNMKISTTCTGNKGLVTNYGEGGWSYKTGGGRGACEVLPLQKKGGGGGNAKSSGPTIFPF